MNRFKVGYDKISPLHNQHLVNGSELEHHLHPHINELTPSIGREPSSILSSDGDSPENIDFFNAVLKYINDMLMEEDFEDEVPILQNFSALQAAEKSFYDVLGQEYPTSLDKPPCLEQEINQPDGNLSWSSRDDSSCSTAAINLVESMWIFDQVEFNSSCIQNSVTDSFEDTSQVANLYRELSSEDTLVISKPLEEDTRDCTFNDSIEKAHPLRRGSSHSEGRSNKHCAISMEEPDVSGILDKVLICQVANEESASRALEKGSQNRASRTLKQNKQTKASDGRTTRSKKKGKQKEIVDLWTLLFQCAKAVAINDQKTANELLRQIRQHSSPLGDGNQRLAHYFADGLEARLAGIGTPGYTPVLSSKTSAADLLRAYQVYVTACPFKRVSDFFANQNIVKVAEKAARIHIIDFGILYGFQWPSLIEHLSTRPGGPPKLRITGIEYPQPGFRPAQRVDETGRHLRNFCEKFNIPFEYNGIAKKWESIRCEDLKIDRSEITIVNCLYKLKNLPDDTMTARSSRDGVLKMIQRVNPDIFIHGIVNGTYNAPFFLTRFRDAFYQFTAIFDMIDATIPREEAERLMIEKEIFGRYAINVVACEGGERIERPETYKQWQVRNLRAGFKQLPLDQEIMKKIRTVVKSNYNEHFVVDEDSQWMLQGWKGRIIYAISTWKPHQL